MLRDGGHVHPVNGGCRHAVSPLYRIHPSAAYVIVRAHMGAVSDSLRSFLEQRLSSLHHIEVVMLLRGDPGRSWTAPEVAAALGSAPETAAMRLFLLASGGLIAFEPSAVPRYRYAAADAETEARLRELSEVFATNRDAVAAVVESPRDPIRSFSDAFKLKK
jgi:hypothetical protein